MLARYLIGGTTLTDADEAFQLALNHAHGKRERPLCLCRSEPIAMYIARIDGRFYIKRMPGSGSTHDPMCVSYEIPIELSGKGSLKGSAITDDAENGGTTLKVAFSLTRRPNRGAIAQSGTVSDTVKSDAHKLSIRSLLHYLWDEAGFNRWSSRMEGKRSWAVIRRHLLAAAEDITIKGQHLGEILYIPEAWTKEQADDIKARRTQHVAKIVPTTGGTHALMLFIGECKGIEQTPFGFKMVVKNAPDFPLYFSKDVRDRITKRFAMEFGLKEGPDPSHLMFVATFSLDMARNAQLDEVSFVFCSKEWIPAETPDEVQLVQSLVDQRRHFIKGLRYNIQRDAPLASVVLVDTIGQETAVYIIPAGSAEAYQAGIEELQNGSTLSSVTWNVGADAKLPVFPPAGRTLGGRDFTAGPQSRPQGGRRTSATPRSSALPAMEMQNAEPPA